MADVVVHRGDTRDNFREDIVSGPRGMLVRRVSWGAIFAGAFVGLACQVLLWTLGLAIGAATINPATEVDPAAGVGWMMGIWTILSSLISLFVGGWVAANLAAFPRMIDGLLHGLVVWGLVSVASLYMLSTSVASIVGGTLSTLKDTAVASIQSPATGQAVRGMQQDPRPVAQQAEDAWNRIRTEANDLMARAGVNPDRAAEQAGDAAAKASGTSAALDPQAEQTLRSLLQRPVSDGDREAAINLLVSRAQMTRDRAEQTVERWTSGDRVLATTEPTERAAREMGQDVANTVTNTALWAFFGMLLAACAAGLGGAMGRPTRVPSTAPAI